MVTMNQDAMETVLNISIELLILEENLFSFLNIVKYLLNLM